MTMKIARKMTCTCLRKRNLKRETESLLIAAKNNKYFKKLYVFKDLMNLARELGKNCGT